MKVVSDFDGVVGNSLPTALNAIRNIVGLFTHEEEVNGFEDYRRLLGRDSSLPGITVVQTKVLRELHRILMLHRADKIELFSDVLDAYSYLREKPKISSSSYSGTIQKALGKQASYFSEIYGFDYGKKEDVLAELWSESEFIYITDSTTDIRRCQVIGIPMIAVCWGYDSRELLRQAKPDFLVTDCGELTAIFQNLNLI